MKEQILLMFLLYYEEHSYHLLQDRNDDRSDDNVKLSHQQP